MDFKELEYIMTIAEEKNITRAAEKLFITPSALTQMINGLEQELGVKLFYRSRSGCFPTESGSIYIHAACEILNCQKNARQRIYDMEHVRNGNLAVAFPPDRGSKMFSSVYPDFHREYPEINIRLTETSVRNQQKLIAQGTVDIGFLSLLDSQRTKDHYLELTEEELLVAVPEDMLPGLTGGVLPPPPPLSEFDLMLLKDVPFALMYQESTMREWQEQTFRRYGIHPRVIFDTSRNATILNMISLGLCCSLVSDFYYDPSLENVAFFRLPGHPRWKLTVSYKRNSYLSEPANCFIRLAKRFYAGEMSQKVAQKKQVPAGDMAPEIIAEGDSQHGRQTD